MYLIIKIYILKLLRIKLLLFIIIINKLEFKIKRKINLIQKVFIII